MQVLRGFYIGSENRLEYMFYLEYLEVLALEKIKRTNVV